MALLVSSLSKQIDFGKKIHLAPVQNSTEHNASVNTRVASFGQLIIKLAPPYS